MTLILATDRLRIREIEVGDLDDLHALDSDPEVMRYITDGVPCSRDQVQHAIERVRGYYLRQPGFGIWAAELKSGGKFIGWVCLKHLDATEMIEVGYRLMREHWNQGLATEATRALLDYGFQTHQLKRITAITHPDNVASQRVLQKCGFERNGEGNYYGRECYFFERFAS